MKNSNQYSLTGLLLIAFFPVLTMAQLPEKFYQITADGNYQFIYWNSTHKLKSGDHAVTVRTFYLETKRQGLIPGHIDYKTFLGLTKDEQRALVNNGEQDVIAAMNNKRNSVSGTEPLVNGYAAGGFVARENQNRLPSFETVNSTEDPEEPLISNGLPWVIQSLTHPGNKVAVPEMTAQNNVDPEQTVKRNEIPWAVRAVTGADRREIAANARNTNPVQAPDVHSSNTRQNTLYVEVADDDGIIHQFLVKSDWNGNKPIHFKSKSITEPKLRKEDEFGNTDLADSENSLRQAENILAESKRRVQVLNLLNELLSQNDEIARKYGKVFPGMDGKIYGTSDAELDEIITALLSMKGDFFNSTNEKKEAELSKIFSELEALALNK